MIRKEVDQTELPKDVVKNTEEELEDSQGTQEVFFNYFTSVLVVVKYKRKRPASGGEAEVVSADKLPEDVVNVEREFERGRAEQDTKDTIRWRDDSPRRGEARE